MASRYPQEDPTGLIAEAYAMDGLGSSECRTLFLDWAIKRPEDADMQADIAALLARFGAPGHPMTAVLREGLERSPRPAPRRRRR